MTTTDMDPLRQLLDTLGMAAQLYKIKSYKDANIEVTFGETSGQPLGFLSGPEKQPMGEENGMPTEDELLFASSIPLSPEEIRARAP